MSTKPLNSKNSKTILGIDPSLNNTGWCVLNCLNSNKFTVLGIGNINNHKYSEIFDKIKNIFITLSDVCNSFSIDSAGIEKTFLNSNPITSLKLGMASGACMSVLCKNEIRFTQYHNREVKKAISGNGAATKDQISFFINNMINSKDFKIKQNDQSDAVAVAICHYFLDKI